MKRKITIIVPIYNASKYLKRCIESIVNQTYNNLEIILIDDGSTDDSGSICDYFASKDKRIKVIHKKNEGVSSSRNYGIKYSAGDYICFLDSDDYYDHNFIKEMYYKILKQDADICYCGYIKFNHKKVKNTSKKCLLNYFSGKTQIQTGCFLIKKSLITNHNLRFEEGVSWGEDYRFFASVIFHAKKIAYLKKYYLYYNIAGSNKLSNVKVDMIEKDKKMVFDIISDLSLSKKEEDMLLQYRLPALLINKIYLLKNEIDLEKIFKENVSYINNIKFNNSLRSIKLYIKKHRLEKKLK